jgi:hypothetical protein
MKRIKRLSMAGVMTLALASATFAGNIHTGAVPPPPPPPEESLVAEPETLTAPGEIQTGLTSSDFGAELIWSLLQVLSVY